MNIQVFLA